MESCMHSCLSCTMQQAEFTHGRDRYKCTFSYKYTPLKYGAQRRIILCAPAGHAHPEIQGNGPPRCSGKNEPRVLELGLQLWRYVSPSISSVSYKRRRDSGFNMVMLIPKIFARLDSTPSGCALKESAGPPHAQCSLLAQSQGRFDAL